jgi:hypothetical protein
MVDWYVLAVFRIASIEALRDFSDVLVATYSPDDEAAWEWVSTAQLEELIDWAEWAMDTDRSRFSSRGAWPYTMRAM